MSNPAYRDQPARDRIARDFDTNLLVEAGAGSGKTHMMALRMAAGIASGAYVVERMAAVTFTRKAASELRGRFQQALEDELRRGAGDPERVARVRNALGRLERFFAGTIHAFCAHLLRQHPVEAGLSPVFDELDEVQDGVMRRNSWREFMKQSHSTGNPMLRELLESGVTRQRLDEAFAVVCGNEDVTFPPGDAPSPPTAQYWKKAEAFAAAIEAILPPELDTECDIQDKWGRFSRTLNVMRKRRARPAALAAVLSIFDNKAVVTQYRWGQEGKQAKKLLDAFRAEAVMPFMTAWRQYLYRLVVSLMSEARAHARRERARRSILNYNDLLILTAELLRGRPEVRRQLQQKFRWLFVDEFQDTDPLQAEIVFLLAGESQSSDWRDVALRDGALFVVGDPKQSIYRFRRADISIYNQVSEKIAGAANGRIESLTTNFRSTPALCAWANAALGPQFPAARTDVSPVFSPLDPKPGAGTPVHAPVYTLSVAGKVGEARPVEAAAIARYIRAEIDATRRRPGDFLILTRNRPQLSIYMNALEALCVPVEVSGAGAFGESAEVAALSLLLRALGDPQDAVTLAGVLRGPLFGVSDPELWDWREAGGVFSIFADATATDGRVSTALATMRRWHRWTRVLPLAAALERILDDSGYLALAATSPDGVEAGDLVHAVDRVRRVVEDGGSLFDAAEAIDSEEDEALDVESLPLEPGRLDVVRLMNLHKAKGLEAKVVFLADPGAYIFERVTRRIAREGTGALGWFLVEEEKERSDGRKYHVKVAEPPDWDDHAAKERPFDQAEETRLLYVAATRAAEMLVVGRGASGKGPWKALDSALAGAPELEIPADVEVGTKWKADISEKARQKASEKRDAAHAAVREASWSASSVTAEARHIAKLARDAEGAADDPTRVVTANTRERRADAGMAWGTLVHGLLEHAMRHDKVDDADLRRLALWLTMETPELRPIIDEAITTVSEVMGSEFWTTAKGAEHLVETPFAVKTSKRDVLFGMVDLMFQTKDGWKLVDYKTDATLPAPGAGGKDAYALQLKAYEDAMKRCQVPTAGAVLHPVRRGSAPQN